MSIKLTLKVNSENAVKEYKTNIILKPITIKLFIIFVEK